MMTAPNVAPGSPATQLARALRSANWPQAIALAHTHSHTSVINATVTSSGLRPLHVAALLGNVDLVMALLRNGAVVDVTAVKLAASHNHTPVLSQLLALAPASVIRHAAPAVFEASFSASSEALHVLVAAGVPVDFTASDGATPLHYAAVSGQQPMIDCLLRAGADSTKVCARGFTPSQWARQVRYSVSMAVTATPPQQPDKPTEQVRELMQPLVLSHSAADLNAGLARDHDECVIEVIKRNKSMPTTCGVIKVHSSPRAVTSLEPTCAHGRVPSDASAV